MVDVNLAEANEMTPKLPSVMFRWVRRWHHTVLEPNQKNGHSVIVNNAVEGLGGANTHASYSQLFRKSPDCISR